MHTVLKNPMTARCERATSYYNNKSRFGNKQQIFNIILALQMQLACAHAVLKQQQKEIINLGKDISHLNLDQENQQPELGFNYQKLTKLQAPAAQANYDCMWHKRRAPKLMQSAKTSS